MNVRGLQGLIDGPAAMLSNQLMLHSSERACIKELSYVMCYIG